MASTRKARNVLAKCPLCQWSKFYWYNGDKGDAKARAECGLGRHLGHKHKGVMKQIKRERRLHGEMESSL